MKIEKQYARRQINGYTSPYLDPFRYRPLEEVGKRTFVEALSRTYKHTLSRDIGKTDALSEFKSLIDFAGSAFDPKYWEIAYLAAETAGVVCAQRYFDKPEEGSLFHLGLVSEFRGRGYGKILHSRGLELLKKQGVVSYVGSTDVLNKAMIKVFLLNGCKLTQIIETEC